jgi:hypothetical protein
MTRTILITHTVYHTLGSKKYPDGLVGITIPPLPNCSHTDVLALADQLLKIASEVRGEIKQGT